MSAFISNGTAAQIGRSTLESGINQNDDCLQREDYRVTPPGMQGHSANQWRDTDVLWTRSSFPSQLFTNGFGGLDTVHQGWEWDASPVGCHVPKIVSGTVYDINGNAVGGATVQLFNTVTGLLVATGTSASDGTYSLGDPNNVACFAVAYLAGSPDTAGTTLDTLMGA